MVDFVNIIVNNQYFFFNKPLLKAHCFKTITLSLNCGLDHFDLHGNLTIVRFLWLLNLDMRFCCEKILIYRAKLDSSLP